MAKHTAKHGESQSVQGVGIKNLTEKRAASEKTEDTAPDRFILQCLADNEVGDARLFNHLNAGCFIFDHSANQFCTWAGHCWREDICNEAMAEGVEAVVEAYAHEVMRQAWCATKAEKAGKEEDAKKHTAKQKALLGRIRSLHAVQRRRNVLTLAAAGTGLVGTEWDTMSLALACVNGILTLKK